MGNFDLSKLPKNLPSEIENLLNDLLEIHKHPVFQKNEEKIKYSFFQKSESEWEVQCIVDFPACNNFWKNCLENSKRFLAINSYIDNQSNMGQQITDDLIAIYKSKQSKGLEVKRIFILPKKYDCKKYQKIFTVQHKLIKIGAILQEEYENICKNFKIADQGFFLVDDFSVIAFLKKKIVKRITEDKKEVRVEEYDKTKIILSSSKDTYNNLKKIFDESYTLSETHKYSEKILEAAFPSPSSKE